MKRTILLLITFLAVPLIVHAANSRSGNTHKQTQTPRTRVTVIDKGPGESTDQRMYRIICPDGRETSIVHDFVNSKVCVTSYQCENGNDVDAAAVKACSSH